ncbi:helix-turn-helix domain-containing protein [Nocardia brasiliensis]|uniref:Helix-turn-helix domain-containing protein n=1 Tax=Nocardia brasiliensis TaxID=37326 RepID=A0A6G9Y0K5_NOCBR|nr:helix-turn-helix transcriptional regulator [Nocardia brasiliensis]QIS06732.1 helix-turn-helix domain-containing protein [Nocardia brasiliensis]
MSDSGQTLPRRQLGKYLRDARNALNLTQESVAASSEVATSVLQRLEKGQATRVKARDLKAICEVLEMADDTTSAMVGLLHQAAEKSWWHAYGDLIPANFDVYVGFETAARGLTMYQPSLVPGLLQTADYARALIRAVNPSASDDAHARRLELRLKRQTIVTRKHQPVTLDVVLHEAALRSNVGGPDVMKAQLGHLAEVGKLANVTVRVLPFSAGAPVGDPIGQFAIMEFGKDAKGEPVWPPVVYLETFIGCMYLEKTDDVRRYDEVHDVVQQAALDEGTSRSLLRQVAKEFSA